MNHNDQNSHAFDVHDSGHFWQSPGCVALAVESSNPSGPSAPGARLGVLVARWEAGGWQTLGEEPLVLDNPQHDDLAACVQRCCARAGIAPRQIGAVCVSTGPGGFTSVRIAVVCAKFVCEVTGALALGVPTAHGVVATLRTQGVLGEAEPCAVALASKGADTFVTLFGGHGRPLREGFLCDAKRLLTLAEGTTPVRTLVADRFLPPAMLETAATLGMRIVEPRFSPVGVLAASVHYAPKDPAELLPVYPREPEAVTKWRQLHARV